MAVAAARPKRRVSPITREKARDRMLALSPAEKQRRLAAMQEGRRRARGPEALAGVEKKMRQLGEEFKTLPRGHERRGQIIRELRPLGLKRARLKWGE